MRKPPPPTIDRGVRRSITKTLKAFEKVHVKRILFLNLKYRNSERDLDLRQANKILKLFIKRAKSKFKVKEYTIDHTVSEGEALFINYQHQLAQGYRLRGRNYRYTFTN